MNYIAYFFSGFFLVNTIPHFVHGVSGKRFPSPFGKPSGVGESSPLSNVIWGIINVIIGFSLLVWAGYFSIGPKALFLFRSC